MKRTLAAGVFLAAALSACGGGGRPSTGEIEDALKSDDNAMGALTAGAGDEVIECVAKALHDSDLSDEALQAIVDNDTDAEAEDGDDEALLDIQDDIAACVVG
jgi:hypothetical protein